MLPVGSPPLQHPPEDPQTTTGSPRIPLGKGPSILFTVWTMAEVKGPGHGKVLSGPQHLPPRGPPDHMPHLATSRRPSRQTAAHSLSRRAQCLRLLSTQVTDPCEDGFHWRPGERGACWARTAWMRTTQPPGGLPPGPCHGWDAFWYPQGRQQL